MNIKFSIIIPTFNRAHLISIAIDSVVRQSNDQWELIIIDDGSTDDTKSVIDAYNDPRIKYVWQENQERSTARNNGIGLATGDWICFLDSDDKYHHEYLQILSKNIDSEDVVIRTNMVYVNENNEEFLSTPKYKGEDNQQYFVASTIGSVLHFAFKKDMLIKYKFTNINMFEDVELLLRILNTHRFKSIDFTSVYALNHNERSLNKVINIDNVCKVLKVFRKTVDDCLYLDQRQKKIVKDKKVLNFLYKSVFENYDSIFLLKKLDSLTPKFILRMLYYRISKIMNHG